MVKTLNIISMLILNYSIVPRLFKAMSRHILSPGMRLSTCMYLPAKTAATRSSFIPSLLQ